MKRSILAASVCLSLPVSTAQAWDWSVKSLMSESIELSDNQFMNPKPLGSVGSYSFLKADVLVQRPTQKFILDSDIRYSKYFGPGAENTPLAETTSLGAHARFEDTLKYGDKNYVDASWRRSDLSSAILDDFGVPSNVKGDVDTTTLQAGLERALTARDSITWYVRGMSTDYVPKKGGTHYTDVTTAFTWKHQVTPNTALLSSTEVERLDYDNPIQTETTILRQTAGLQSQLTPLLYFRGSVGFSYVDTRQDSPTIAPVPIGPNAVAATPLTGGSGSAVGFLADGYLTYKMDKTTDLTVYARQTLSPSIVGSLLQRQSYGASVHHNINYSSSITTSGDLSRQSGDKSSTDFYTASVAYNYQLTRAWNTQLTYRFQYRVPTSGNGSSFDPITGLPIASSGSDPVMSNSVMFMVSRSFVELPPGR